MEPDPILALTRTLDRIVWATAALYVLLALAGALVFVKVSSEVHQNESARRGLCALRADLARRQLSSRDFLRAHPHGIPGIPASLIRNGIKTTDQTLKALDVVKCIDE